MDLEEAKKILDTFTFRIKTKNYNKIDYDDIKAIKIVLTALDNSVSKDKIRKVINENCYPDTYNFKTISVSKIEELLNKGE